MAMGSQDNKKKSRKWKNRHFIQALVHAWDGLTTSYREERNFRCPGSFNLFLLAEGYLAGRNLAAVCHIYSGYQRGAEFNHREFGGPDYQLPVSSAG